MQVKRTERAIHVVLDRGEKVMESLARVAREYEIPGGSISGIGALRETRLGFYHLSQKHYDEKCFEDEAELVSLLGNISWFEGNPVIHCHAALGAPDFSVFGGHLFEAEVAVTVEIIVTPGEHRVERIANCDIGLNLQKL